jgi:glycosyltransferase involved in cell wall biosynthesis
MDKLPLKVAHYGKNDPDTNRGGVESFARNHRRIFEDVLLMHPGNLDVDRVRSERRMVICDNQRVLDWPEDIPVVGFQHGVAAVKAKATGNGTDRRLARAQSKAAKRPNTLWVACAEWIADEFERRHGTGAKLVIYHHVDLERFDGARTEYDPRLVLHDARGKHKGEALVVALAERFRDWKLEPLACLPDEVSNRMRRARAFLHVSRYEGNSIVCNEAMAMDLPLFATRVGLMQDPQRPRDVFLVDADRAFRDSQYFEGQFARFLQSLESREYHPRGWVLEHAHLDVARERWRQVAASWDAMMRQR